MLPVSLDCSCFIALSVFYNIYLSCVLSTLCCQFLWIVHVLLPFRYSITFICPVSCLLYVASFSGLFMTLSVFYNICPVSCLPMLPVSLDCSCFITLSVFYNIYLSCVLSTLCYQFLWIVHVLLPCQLSLTFVLCLVYSMFVFLDCSCFITLRYSMTFICPVSCLLYAASFSGLFMFYYPFGIL